MRGFFVIAAATAAFVLVPGSAPAAPPNPWLAAARAAEEPVLTPAQMLDRAREDLKRVEAIVAEVGELHADAEDEKDILLENCLGELHSQSRALLKAGKETLASLEESVQANDADASARLFARIQATRKRAEKIADDASSCIGASAGADGRYGADLLARPDLADPTDPDSPTPPVVRPPPSSPTT